MPKARGKPGRLKASSRARETLARLGVASGQCMATTHKSAGLDGRWRKYRPTRCARRARSVVGLLCLCSQHAKMTREGLVDREGHVAHPDDRRNVHRYPKRFPHGLHTWAAS